MGVEVVGGWNGRGVTYGGVDLGLHAFGYRMA